MDWCHSEHFRLELNITPIIANIDSYRKCWGEHLLRMDGSQIPKITFKCGTSKKEVGIVKTEQAKDLTLERKMMKNICPMNGRVLTIFHAELEGHVKKFHELHHGNIHTISIC